MPLAGFLLHCVACDSLIKQMIDTKGVILAQKAMRLMPKFRWRSHVAVPEGLPITPQLKPAFDTAVRPLVYQLTLARGARFAKLG